MNPYPRGYKLHWTGHWNLQVKSICTKPKNIRWGSFFKPQVSSSASWECKSQRSPAAAVTCLQQHTPATLVPRVCPCMGKKKGKLHSKLQFVWKKTPVYSEQEFLAASPFDISLLKWERRKKLTVKAVCNHCAEVLRDLEYKPSAAFKSCIFWIHANIFSNISLHEKLDDKHLKRPLLSHFCL